MFQILLRNNVDVSIWAFSIRLRKQLQQRHLRHAIQCRVLDTSARDFVCILLLRITNLPVHALGVEIFISLILFRNDSLNATYVNSIGIQMTV